MSHRLHLRVEIKRPTNQGKSEATEFFEPILACTILLALLTQTHENRRKNNDCHTTVTIYWLIFKILVWNSLCRRKQFTMKNVFLSVRASTPPLLARIHGKLPHSRAHQESFISHLIDSWVCGKEGVHRFCLPVLGERLMLIYAAILSLCFYYRKGSGLGFLCQEWNSDTILHAW